MTDGPFAMDFIEEVNKFLAALGLDAIADIGSRPPPRNGPRTAGVRTRATSLFITNWRAVACSPPSFPLQTGDLKQQYSCMVGDFT